MNVFVRGTIVNKQKSRYESASKMKNVVCTGSRQKKATEPINLLTNNINCRILCGKYYKIDDDEEESDNDELLYNGNCLVGIDLDVKDSNDIYYTNEIILEILKEIGLPETYAVSTGSGGAHIYLYIQDGIVGSPQDINLSSKYKELLKCNAIDIRGEQGLLIGTGSDFTGFELSKSEIKRHKREHSASYTSLNEFRIAKITAEEWNNCMRLISGNNPSKLSIAYSTRKEVSDAKYGNYEPVINEVQVPKKVVGKVEQRAEMLLKRERLSKESTLLTIEEIEKKMVDAKIPLPWIEFMIGIRQIIHTGAEKGAYMMNGKRIEFPMKEMSLWTGIFRAAYLANINDQSVLNILKDTQPVFERQTCVDNLKYLGKTSVAIDSYWRNRTLKKYFPKWFNSKKKHGGSKNSGRKADPKPADVLRQAIIKDGWINTWIYAIDSDQFYYYDPNTGLYKSDRKNREITRIENKIYEKYTGIPTKMTITQATQIAYDLVKEFSFDRVFEEQELRLQKNFLACDNCILEYIDGSDEPIVHEFDPKLIILQKIETPFLPELVNEETPFWDEYKIQYPEMIADIERYIRNVIRGKNIGDIMIYLVGPGGRGKSTIYKIMDKMFRGIVGEATIKSLVDTHGLAVMVGKRLMMKTEISTGYMPADGAEFFKKYTGDEGVLTSINEKYIQQYDYEFRDMFFIFTSNGLPTLTKGQDGWWRRARVHEFVKKIRHRRTSFIDNLKSEIPILFAKWATAGAYHFCEDQELDSTCTSNEAIEEKNKELWLKWSLPVQHILNELFITKSQIKEEAIAEYKEKKEQCEANGVKSTNSLKSYVSSDLPSLSGSRMMKYVKAAMEIKGMTNTSVSEQDLMDWTKGNDVVYSKYQGVTTYKGLKLTLPEKVLLRNTVKKKTCAQMREAALAIYGE